MTKQSYNKTIMEKKGEAKNSHGGEWGKKENDDGIIKSDGRA